MKQSDMSDVLGIMKFLNHAEQLKTTMRQCWASNGKQESTAEHTWRLCLMVMLFEKNLPEVNVLKLMKMCLIHDIAEIIDGDIPATLVVPNKSEKERKNLIILSSPLPLYLKEEILALWDEYEAAETNEAKISKALDKLETIMQHNVGENPSDFNYEFNLTYGKKYTNEFDIFEKVREIIDQVTHSKIEQTKKVA